MARLEAPELKSALATLGAVPPSRSAATNKLLNDAYSRAVNKANEEISKWPVVCVTMDGWKKRACEQGAPLITVVILLPDGTNIFWKVCVFSGAIALHY